MKIGDWVRNLLRTTLKDPIGEELNGWIRSTLIREPYFDPAGAFQLKQVIFTVEQPDTGPTDDALSELLDDPDFKLLRDPEWLSKYSELLQTIRLVSENEVVYWFYARDPDNAFSQVYPVVRYSYDRSPHRHLHAFITCPPVEGGDCNLSLVAASKCWLLQHEWGPSDSFEISIHGPENFCRQVAATTCWA
jgi:hypothetical protein